MLFVDFCRRLSSKFLSSSRGGGGGWRRWKSNSSTMTVKYLKRQSKDEFCRAAREHSYRARSAFKLMEIDDKHGLLRPGDLVVDIGAAPGSWCQVAVERTRSDEPGSSAYVLGVDLQNIEPIIDADLLSLSDVLDRKVQLEIRRRLNGRLIDCLLCDMAPNPTGDRQLDHERIVRLCEKVLDLISDDREYAALPIKSGGHFLCKIWDGVLRTTLVEKLQEKFSKVQIVKPSASRDDSAEIFLLSLQRKKFVR